MKIFTNLTLFFLFNSRLPEGFVQAFVCCTDDSEWQVVGEKWIYFLFAVIVLSVLFMAGIKFLRKYNAPNPQMRNWSLGQTIGFICIGFIPLTLLCLVGWKFVMANVSIIGGYGLMIGILFCIFSYFLFMLFIHFISPWRRDLYPK